MILVSACLVGINCKYNGNNNKDLRIIELMAKGKAIPVCPELLGGLPTPRPAAEIQGGEGRDILYGTAAVQNNKGENVTNRFVKGAKETLKVAELAHVTAAIFKQRSPSCGSGQIYDGTFSGKVVAGDGIASAVLKEKGIKVFSEENAEELLKNINFEIY